MPVVVYHSYSYKPETGRAEKDRPTISGFEFPDKPMNAYPGVIVDGDFIGVQFHPERMSEIGFWCRYTVIQTLGKDILESNKSQEEKLEKLKAWEKRLDDFKEFYKKYMKEEEGTPSSLRIFQNFVSMVLESSDPSSLI